MSRLYYHHENKEENIDESINSANECADFIKSWINNEVKMHEYNYGKILER